MENFGNKYTPFFNFQEGRVVSKRSSGNLRSLLSLVHQCVSPPATPRLCYSSVQLKEDESIPQINVCVFLFLWILNKEHTFVVRPPAPQVLLSIKGTIQVWDDKRTMMVPLRAGH